jgi:hypothetical protein
VLRASIFLGSLTRKTGRHHSYVFTISILLSPRLRRYRENPRKIPV